MADHIFTELSTLTVIITCLLISSTSAQSCGGTLNSTAGDITSPNFPSQPEANITCVWYIIKTDRYAILHLGQLELTGAEASLQIYSGNVTAGSSELVGNVTEDSEVRQVITSDNVTTVVLFTGEWPIDNKTAIFNLHYKTAPVCKADLSAWSLRLKSPLCSSGALPLKCSYNIKKQNSNSSLTLSFEEFNMQGGKVTVKQNNQTLADLLGTKIPEDVFIKGDNFVLEYWTNTSQTSEFTAMVNSINQGCLFNITLTDWGIPVPLKRPSHAQAAVRCQWVIQVPDNGTVRISTDQNSVMSSHVMVSDGWSLFGSERRIMLGLPQSGTSYVSSDKTVSVYLSSDPSLTTSEMVLTATPQKYGGVFHTSGSLEGHGVNLDGSSQWYYYLINPHQQKIRLLMTNSSLFPASSIKCYDGLTESCPLLADFRSDRPFYPVVSSGSQMLVVASNLEYRGFFTAEFSPDIDGCDQISEGRQGQYRGSVTPKGSEVKVCTWIIKPVQEEGVFLIKLSMSGFGRADNLTLFDGLSEYNINVLLARGEKWRRTQNIPTVIVPATTGARLSYSTNAMNQTVTRSVKGEYFFTSDKLCGGSLPQNESGNIVSPSFPNERYPLNIHCDWNTSVSLGKLLYLTFETFDLDPGHSVNVFPYVNATEVNSSGYVFNGSSVPSDILIPGPHINITFTTEKFHQGGNSGRGFNISYRTIDVGGELTSRKGEISTPDFPTSVSSSMECIWIIEVPAKGDNSSSVPIISMDFDLESFSQMSEKNLLEFRDGNSQHAPLSDVKLTNGKTKGVYSRTNQLWIRYLYTLHNSSGNAPGFAFKMTYNTYDCPKAQQCDNGVCMQTGWKCDGVDQCGDESDEKNCSNTVTTKTGVAGFVVALLVLIGFAVGVIAALVAPSVYKRLRYPNYRHLRDVVSPIET